MIISKKKRLGLGLAATALAASTMVGSANADPAQYNAFVGVGSDTTQDVLNALAGRSGNLFYTPVTSSAPSGARQLVSFDATPPAGVTDNCITPRIGSPTFSRPNGSSAGRRALSRAIDGTGYGLATTCAEANVSGQIQFARSSAGPASGDTGTTLTYVPMARDALSFAFYRPAGSPVTELTRAQLTTLFTTGPQTIGGVRIVPCGIQDGSGTFQSWNTLTTATTAQEATATTLCRSLLQGAQGTGRLQESDGPELIAAGNALVALPGEVQSQVVIGFSASSFIARTNGVSAPAPGAGVGIGSISNDGAGNNLGSPVIAGTTLAPNPTFFGNGVFGRTVYNVFPTSVVTGPGNGALKSMFFDQASISGNEATLCAASSTINTFGFLVAPNCGNTQLQGSLFTGKN